MYKANMAYCYESILNNMQSNLNNSNRAKRLAQETVTLIFDALEMLTQHPEVGRKVHFGQRELVISRGRTGYLALYRYLPHTDRILVLALRHQREAGYKSL